MNEPPPTTANPTLASPTLARLIAELLAATPGGAAGHPAPERLLAYRAGELAGDEEGAVQDHLVACPACTAVLLDLDELEAAAQGSETTATGSESGAVGATGGAAARAEGLGMASAEPGPGAAGTGAAAAADPAADFATAAAWRRLAPHVAPEGSHEVPGHGKPAESHGPLEGSYGAQTASPRRDRRAGRRPWRSPALAWAVAAALAVVAVGLGVDRARLERAAAGTGGGPGTDAAAQANVPVLYLDPTTRAESAGEPLSLAAGPGSLVVIATPEAAQEHPEYRLTLRDGTGQVVATVAGLTPSEYATLRAVLPRPAAGDYVLALEGRAADGWRPAGTYPLRVDPAAP